MHSDQAATSEGDVMRALHDAHAAALWAFAVRLTGGDRAAAEDVVTPFIPRLPWMDRSSIVQGYAGVYSSFLLHAQRAAERYGVPAYAILERVGEAGYVGGQEDMIIDVALALREERELAGQEALAGQTG